MNSQRFEGKGRLLHGRVFNILVNIQNKYFEALTNHLCKIIALSLCTITFLFQERNGEKHINRWAQQRWYFWNNGEVIIQQTLFASKDVSPLKPREHLLEKVPLAEVYIDYYFGVSGLPAWLDRWVKLQCWTKGTAWGQTVRSAESGPVTKLPDAELPSDDHFASSHVPTPSPGSLLPRCWLSIQVHRPEVSWVNSSRAVPGHPTQPTQLTGGESVWQIPPGRTLPPCVPAGRGQMFCLLSCTV